MSTDFGCLSSFLLMLSNSSDPSGPRMMFRLLLLRSSKLRARSSSFPSRPIRTVFPGTRVLMSTAPSWAAIRSASAALSFCF